LHAPSLPPLLKGDLAETQTISLTTAFLFSFLAFSASCAITLISRRRKILPPIMAASHPHLLQQSVADESEIHQLVVNHFLLNHAVLQWRPTTGEDIPTPNTKEIVVFSSFFQREFVLPTCDFLRGLLDHYQIELVHLNPNSILQIAVFVHLCEAFLGIPPNFPLFKNYFFLKYQHSVANRKVIGGVGLKTRPRANFLNLLMKTSLWG
jgi:hypothetical protein